MILSLRWLLLLAAVWLSPVDSTSSPSISPSRTPSVLPTSLPSRTPTLIPTNSPTTLPTNSPTRTPSIIPTRFPSVLPTALPSRIPTTNKPTYQPTVIPTYLPTFSPTYRPTLRPTVQPTPWPTKIPTVMPTSLPTSSPSFEPSYKPTPMPTFSIQAQSQIAIQTKIYDAFFNIGLDSTVTYLTLNLDQSSLSTDSLGHIDTYIYIPSNGTYILINQCSLPKACAIYEGSAESYCLINYDVTDYVSNTSNGAISLIYEYNIGDGTTVSPNCIYKGISGVYFVMTATVGRIPSPTSAPTTFRESDSVTKLNSQAPYYVTGLAFFLFAGLGVVIVRLREKNASLVQLDIFKICIELATLGASMVSELYLIANMFTTPGYLQFGVSLLTFRLIHVIPSSYIFITLFAPLEACKKSVYHTLISKDELHEHLNEYTVVIVFIWVESLLLKLLPWNHSSFAALSSGFPDIHLMRNVLYVKLLQSLVSIIIQSIVISKYGFGFALSYVTLSLSVITFVQGLIKSIVKVSVMKDRRVSILNCDRLGSAEDAMKLSQLIEHGKISQADEGVSVIDMSHIRSRVSSFYAYVVQALNGSATPTNSNPDSHVTGESKTAGELELGTTIASKDDSSSRSNTSSLTSIIKSVRLNMSSLFISSPAVKEAPTVTEADFTLSIISRDREGSMFEVQNPVIAVADELADDWIELFHKKYQRVYWKNTVTGEKSWKKPLKAVYSEDLRSNFVKTNSDSAAGSAGSGVSINFKKERSSAKSAFLDRVVQMPK